MTETTYTEQQYTEDYAEHLSSLTPEELAKRGYLGGVFVGLLTRDEWQQRDAEMRERFGSESGMSDGSYEAYLRRCRVNTENVRRRSEERERQTHRFFEAERLGIPHHGQTDERL